MWGDNMIYPGETKEQVFVMPYPYDAIDTAIVTYRQNNAVVFEKTADEFEVLTSDKSRFSIALAQEDTLMLKDNIPCYMQVNVILVGDNRKVSAPFMETVGIQYHREVEEAEPPQNE